ncbi:T9SS type B sorting domain-containing protein [Taibaiella koreensis]|uniref:T9SS type B sorting domain-containing protein n=1 Tax=Taibaiella koreensis TaxID=1268548 RepID=UPI000E59E900|nr:gliding motility-associated C-terminal domain-containing protein [Taibaiella koreensis]
MRQKWLIAALYCILLVPAFCRAQDGRNNIWYAPFVALDFNAGAGPAFLSPAAIPSNGQPASVCDAAGALLFYTNGNIVYGRDHLPMPGGILVNGDPVRFDHQPCSAVILPKGGDQYYLFSLLPDSLAVNLPAGAADTMIQPSLYYSVIDMSLNGGNGDIVPGSKKILVKSGLMRCFLLAAPGPGCDDRWIAVHEATTAAFLSYPVTAAGLGVPVHSVAGVDYLGDNRPGYGSYYGKLSPDARKLALFSLRNSIAMPFDPGSYASLELLDFDQATGVFSNAASLYENLAFIPFMYGFFPMDFSPDSKKLYTVQRTDYDVATWNKVVQYDLNVASIASIRASETLVGVVPPVGAISSPFLTDMRLGPDDKLYLAAGDIFPLSTGSVIPLARINAPNAPAAAAGWETGIGSPLIGEGFPMLFPVANIDPQRQVTTAKTTLPWCGTPLPVTASRSGSYLWNNGSNTAAITVDAPGIYWVQITEDCGSHTDTFNLEAPSPLPANLLPGDTSLCRGQQWTIDLPIVPGVSYTWSDGATGNRYTVKQSGWIRVFAQNACGNSSDSLQVTYGACTCDYLFIPNAFSPNADGRNDVFLPRYPCSRPVHAYELRIYNRWGQEIFITHNPDQGWDGTMSGQKTETGVYHYTVNIQAEGSGDALFRKGQLTLLR